MPRSAPVRLLLVLGFALLSCDEATAPRPVRSLSLTPTVDTIAPGALLQLVATTRDASDDVLIGRTVTWLSSNPNVATVSNTGAVRALLPGEVTITASSEATVATAVITVREPVLSVTVTPPSGNIRPGVTLQLTAVPRDRIGRPLDDRVVTWTTSNPSVATVSQTGLVTTLTEGDATITATSEGVRGVAAWLVASVLSITMSPALDTLAPGELLQIQAVPLSSSQVPLLGREVVFSSSNEAVATVSAGGLVTTKLIEGSATISATSEGRIATTTIVVEIPVATVTVSPSTITLAAGGTVQMTATARDAAGNPLPGRLVTWSKSNNPAATVSSTGLVTAVSKGTVVIIATARGKSGTASVKVQGAVEYVRIEPGLVNISPAATVQLSAQAWDESDEPVTGFPVTWWSSNESIARVSPTGLVTGVANGAATIFASIDSRVGAVAITVASVASVAVEPATFRLVVGGVAGPGATPRDAAGNALSRPVTWSTSNDAIATVSSTGIVTGVSLGTVTITATSEGHSASVTVTIERVALSSIVAGMNVSCGLTPAGAAYCWGDRSSGLVGNAPGIECEIEYWYYYMYTYISPCATTPTEIVTAHRFTSLAIGGYHVCGIATGGQAYCWGGNGDGQLGNGTNTPSTTPLPVAGGFTFSALAAGAGHTCGLTTAGAAYCWGTNYAGQLGNGSRVVNFTPAPVAGGLTFSNLSAGYDHTCGIADATAYCWGSNAAGALGTGGTGGQHSIPTRVSGSMVFASITAGTSYTCGVLDNGSAYCWGANAYGQLGVSGTSNRSAPTAVTGALVFSRLTAGNWHTCGVTTAGAAYCWGYNEGGRLGSGVATSFVAIPTAVAGGLLFTNLSAGSDHSCGVTTGSVAYCWGNNDFGQLGNPILTDRLAPTLVTGQP